MRKKLLALALCVSVVSAPAGAADLDVDLELVLAVDVSRSMDVDEQELQRLGYVEGIQHPEVIGAIRSGMLGRIAVTYVEWAGPIAQKTVVPWTVIDGAESAAAFAAKLGAGSVARLHGTSISGALGFTARLFDNNGLTGMREVIDVSGDGPNNMGGPVLASREAALARGVTINGLPIMLKQATDQMFSIRDLDVYYEDCVIGGPGAFLVTITSPEKFAEAIRRKLVLEIAGQPARPLRAGLVAVQERGAPRIDCEIGEKMRMRWMRQ